MPVRNQRALDPIAAYNKMAEKTEMIRLKHFGDLQHDAATALFWRVALGVAS
jgi:hypothetical protein